MADCIIINVKEADLDSPARGNLLSVVLPTYGVEAYLAECLESILDCRTLHEIIVVNDCSPDLSPEIAEAYVARDPRVKLVENEANKGLGASRNVGARFATGEYLLFADSDDLLVAAAVDRMVETLELTGSNFATAPADEFGRHKFRKRYWTTTSPVFRDGALKTNIDQHPELINDHTAWTKVFRRTFWEQNELEWAEGVKCEDVRASSRAYSVAGAVDVVPSISYLYRRRPGSITSTLTDDKVIGDWARETLAALQNVCNHEQAWQIAMQKVISTELRSRLAAYRAGLQQTENESFEQLLDYLADHCSEQTLDNCDPETREIVERWGGSPTAAQAHVRTQPSACQLLLSIVMPTFNVEEWVGDTIKSILEGSWQKFELIVIDDSSSDRTAEIVQQFQSLDGRIRLERNPGSGGAQARNYGASLASGSYLVFVDGDDLVPARGFEHLIRSLEASGSDMAVGDFQKFWPTSTWRNSAEFGLDEKKIATSLVQAPKLIGNRTCWNRMFRRAFYENASIHFPSSPRANDILPMTLAMSKAKTIDVVPRIVYNYRARSGSSSMTSALGTTESLMGYFRQESLCSSVLPRPCPVPLQRTYWRTALGVDGWGNFKKFIQASSQDADFDGISQSFGELWDQAPADLAQIIGDFKTLVYHFIATGDIDAARKLVDVEGSPKTRESAALVAELLLRVDDIALADSMLRVFHDWVLRPVIDDRGEWITDEVEALVSLTAKLSERIDLQEAAIPETREPQVVAALASGEENGLWRIVRGTKKRKKVILTAKSKDGNLLLDRDPSDDHIAAVQLVEKGGQGRRVPIFFAGDSVEITEKLAGKMAGVKWTPIVIDYGSGHTEKLPTEIKIEKPLKRSERFRVTSNSIQILYSGLERLEKSIEWRLRKSPDSSVARLAKRFARKDVE